MDRSRRCVLIAGLAPLMRDVRRVLAADFVTISAESFQEAQLRLHEDKPNCVLVAYHFDDVQSFRLIRYIREDRRFDEVPIILVCVLPFKLGATEEEVRAAHQDLGVDEFLNLYEDAKQRGAEAALMRLHSVCMRCCAAIDKR